MKNKQKEKRGRKTEIIYEDMTRFHSVGAALLAAAKKDLDIGDLHPWNVYR